MKLVYAPEAVADLIRLRSFIADKSPAAAARIAAELIARIENLCAFPHLGRAVRESPQPNVVRDMAFGNYVVAIPNIRMRSSGCAFGTTGRTALPATSPERPTCIAPTSTLAGIIGKSFAARAPLPQHPRWPPISCGRPAAGLNDRDGRNSHR